MRIVATISTLLALTACGGGSAPIERSSGGPVALPAPAVELSAHCRAADDTMKRVWNDRIRNSIRVAFASTTRPYADDTAARVATTLDAYASDIAASRAQLCRLEADDARAPTRDAHFCLDRRLSVLEAMTDLFIESVNENIVDNAVRATYELDPVVDCADSDALLAAPDDDDDRHALLHEWAADDEVRVRLWVSAYPDAYERLLPLVARTTGAMAIDIERAVLHAELAGRVTTVSARRNVIDAALVMVTEAGDVAARDAVLIRRVAISSTTEARRLGADVLAELGPRDDAALALSRLYAVLGDKELAAGQKNVALEHFRNAVATRIEALGDDHPAVADALTKAGDALGELGKPQSAAELHGHAADIYGDVLGTDHLSAAQARYDQGWQLEEADQLDRAAEAYDAALAARERAFPPGELEVTWVQRRLVETLTASGKHAEAERRAREMYAEAEAALPNDSLGLARVSKMLGRILWHRELWDEAEEYFGRALDIRRALLPAKSIDITWSIHDMGDVACGRGDYREGVELYNEARKRFLEHRYTRYIAHIRWDLARCLWTQGTDQKRALDLAARARDGYANIDASRSLEIGAWLQERGVTK